MHQVFIEIVLEFKISYPKHEVEGKQDILEAGHPAAKSRIAHFYYFVEDTSK